MLRALLATILVLAVAAIGVVAWYRNEPVLVPITNLILTAALVWFTAELVREGRLSREVRQAPAVSVYLRPSSEGRQVMELVIENHGGGPAHDISLEIDRDLVVWKHANLSSTPVVRDGLRFLPPKGLYSTVIGDAGFLKANAAAHGGFVPSVRVLARCVASSGRMYEQVSWLDLSPRSIATPAAVRAADSLETIAKKLP